MIQQYVRSEVNSGEKEKGKRRVERKCNATMEKSPKVVCLQVGMAT
jgi:hypothetical protein